MTLAQLMSSSVSNQDSHPSLQGGHLPFSGSNSGKSAATSTLKLEFWERKEHLTLFTEGLPAPLLVAQLICRDMDLQRPLKVALICSGAEYRFLLQI